MRDTFDVPKFGYLCFDNFILEHWDPNSALSKNEQKRYLLNKWIRLGRYGRNEYFKDAPDAHDIPYYIPQDLLTGAERQVDGQLTRTIFIRTWFGEKNDKASQDAADKAYKRLLVYVLKQGDPDDEYDYCMESGFIYDKKEEFFGDNDDDDYDVSQSPDIADGIALGTPGSVPSYLVTALMHCPDQFDGNSYASKWRNHTPSEARVAEAEVDTRQNLLVLVADKRACEDGWVLFLAINHKGQVLPFRIRGQAREASTINAWWMEGQALAENTLDPDKDEECYLHEGNGWD